MDHGFNVSLLYAGGRGELFSQLTLALGRQAVHALGPQDRRANVLRNAFHIMSHLIRLRPGIVFAVNPVMGISAGLAMSMLNRRLRCVSILAHHVFPAYCSDPVETRRMMKYFRAFDWHVVVSPSMEREIRPFVRDTARIECIPNAVDMADIQSQLHEGQGLAHPCPPHRWRCLHVGGLRPDKRVDRLLYAFASLPEREQAILLLVGDGDARGDLEALARSLGIAERCLFVGHQARPWAWAKGCDLFVQTPDWETFGLSVLEAMAAGLPVLTTGDNSPGLKDVVHDGVNGCLVESGDVDEFAKRWSGLLHDRCLRQRLVQAGFKTAQRFSLDAMRSRYVSFLSSCLV